jgi:hypothetical protein
VVSTDIVCKGLTSRKVNVASHIKPQGKIGCQSSNVAASELQLKSRNGPAVAVESECGGQINPVRGLALPKVNYTKRAYKSTPLDKAKLTPEQVISRGDKPAIHTTANQYKELVAEEEEKKVFDASLVYPARSERSFAKELAVKKRNSKMAKHQKQSFGNNQRKYEQALVDSKSQCMRTEPEPKVSVVPHIEDVVEIVVDEVPLVVTNNTSGFSVDQVPEIIKPDIHSGEEKVYYKARVHGLFQSLNILVDPPEDPVVKPRIIPINSRIDRREMQVEMVKYTFPELDFIGLWNPTNFSELGKVYAQHKGLHVHFVDKIIEIPDGLISELGTFWAHKKHDDLYAEFMVSVVKCRKWTEIAHISFEQERVANLYAPAIAYLRFWDEQQNVSRVVDQAYSNALGIKSSISKFLKSFRNSPTSYKVVSGSMLAAAVPMGWSVANRFKKLIVSPLNDTPLLSGSTEQIGAAVIANYFNSCVIVPTAEETIKRASGGWLLETIEFGVSCMSLIAMGYDWRRVLLLRGSALLMHKITVRLPFWQGVALHGVWNAVSIYYNDVFVSSLGPAVSTSVDVLSGNFLSTVTNHLAYSLVTPIVSFGFSLFGSREVVGNYKCLTTVICPPVLKQKQSAKVVVTGAPEYMRYKIDEENKGKQYCMAYNTGLYAPNAYASNFINEQQATAARVTAETIEPVEGAIESCVEWAKTNHKSLFPNVHYVSSLSFDAYLLGSNASPSVKRILRKTYDRMKEDGHDEESILTKCLKYRWTSRSSFVKVENNLYCSPAGVTLKAPRMIQGAQPEYICIVGPWIAALQILLKRRWGSDNFLCFTSGLSAKALADAIDKPNWLKLEDDLGKFDTSIRRPWCEYEVWLCEKFGAPRAVLDLMSANISTHGHTHHGITYKVDGTRKSGDPFTSLFNSVINGIAHLYLYCKYTNKTVEQAKESIVMILQGDDNVLTHAEKRQFPWQKGMATLGFDSKAMYREEDTVEFCSNRLYRTTDGLVFGPKPGKVLAKFGYIINPPLGVSRESLMRGVALGLQKQCNFIPPIKVVIDRVLDLTSNHKAVFCNKYMEHKMKVSKFYESTPEIDYQLYEQYGWNTEMQHQFKQIVATSVLGGDFNHPYAQLLFDRDTSGPQSIF